MRYYLPLMVFIICPLPVLPQVIITEIMYNPLPGNEEWIEVYNSGVSHVDLQNWRLGDERLPEGMEITPESYPLAPGEYVAIGKSMAAFIPFGSSIRSIVMQTGYPQLNNDGDAVVVRNAGGITSDSVRYEENWSTMPGISLERIRLSGESNGSLHWGNCVDPSGGTPGRINSLFYIVLAPRVEILVSPNPFSPDGDGWEDEAVIEFNLPMETSHIRLEIYDRTGKRIKTLLNHQPAGSAGSVTWDGRDDEGKSIPIGVYIIFLEAIRQTTGKLESGKGVIVVATRL